MTSENILLKGINLYEDVNMDGDALVLGGHKGEKFKIPFDKIKNSAIYNQNEIEIDIPFEDHDENHHVLCEARFFIPYTETETEMIEEGSGSEEEEEGKEKEKEENDEEKSSKMEEEGQEKEEEEVKDKEPPALTYAETIHKELRKKAKIDESMGELICTIQSLSLVVPRGKYMVDLHKNNMRLHGSTFNYKIMYQDIVKAFLLPMNNDIHYSIVLGFSKPLRQGNTIYPYIIFQFKKAKKINLEMKASEELLNEIHPSLKPFYSGPAYEVVAKLFKMIIKVSIIIPGSFKTSSGHSSLKCNVGNQEGYLFLMNKSMIFIKKPVIYIRVGDIARVEFQRVSGGISMRGFDFEVVLKSGISTTFSGADKKELDIIMNYFSKAKIHAKTINEMEKLDEQLGSFDDEDDEDLRQEDLEDLDDEDDDDFVVNAKENAIADEDDEDYHIDED